ncbi:BZ3500_MvSof-1268-A1-R1_Chr5-3g08190 [Microbotryum saponariae]|uniref:BZ3500_MvSof-1268-A1-R1_Chr5-3g08190 protein n=1 Tax=Microbotryum saponariae TaxID=289078 RepID=A0A2X0KEK6_9BASI|nr:BZ3500_MvSof-1268-A1-R1_Chr5-3g08190 [Microbotryum saponariae]SDA07949.1 BZ3501_MvSof-1269-A2-R1_Chr5-1g07334 [Microbotryum saponariae]
MPTEDSAPRKAPFDYAHASIADIRKAASEVEQRVADRRKQLEQQADGDSQERERERATKVLQNRYRAGRPLNLTSSERWTEGMRARKLSGAGKEQDHGVNDATSRWKRSEVYAAKLSEGQHAKKGALELTEAEEMKRFGRVSSLATCPYFLSCTHHLDYISRIPQNKKERKRIREEREISQQMQAQYWLEMVDAKHRYGTNLKWYHKAWNESDSPMNFFKWLDEGPGKELDLEQCPRARLEKERITYLTAETRKNYLVRVTDEGKLVWARNGGPVDTSKFHKDGGPETGIVKISKEEYEAKEKEAKEKRRKIRDNGGKEVDSSSSSSSDEAEEIFEGAQPYDDKPFDSLQGGTAGSGKGVQQFKARVSYYTSPRAVADQMLRKTVSKNTWLYVADLKASSRDGTCWDGVDVARVHANTQSISPILQGNLYVSLKVTGKLQHSSILYGARVMSAGLIKVDNGSLTSLSPLSGHYRAGTMHFKAFVRSLEDRNVDMSSVSISKSVITIRALEKYGKFSKKKASLTDKIKAGLGMGKTEEEEKKEEREKEEKLVQNQRVELEKKQDEDSSSSDSHSESDEEDRGKKHRRKLTNKLPGEGKKVEDMTEDERTERGVALIQRAFERGLNLEEKRIAEHATEKQKELEEEHAEKKEESKKSQ